jgi:putative acetyltransferase
MLIAIKQATQSDLDTIIQLFSDTIGVVNAIDYSAEQIRVWKGGASKKEKWLKKISEQYFLIAEIDNMLAGFGSITHDGYLDFMYVSKDHQGRGVASEIYNSLEKFAVEKRIDKIVSDVSITAKPFFEKQGFELLQEQQVAIDGVKLRNYKMQKPLTVH